ncbi:hypothetical protein LCGC14_1650070 [marine sediment metagenome]|uniref:Glycosyltransferase 2-like domain-containing protein n=1 Tax=marine sediment metagenome TaxID=412755 RepID=A0A0F9HXW2_9ZZZZ
MKVSAFICLHHGQDYLEYAIRSVVDIVDEVLVVYSPKPSHGQEGSRPCPESRERLYGIAKLAAGGKLRWKEGDFASEGAHRDFGVSQTKGDIVLVLDADEVWDKTALKEALEEVQHGEANHYLVNPVHLWRSFKWICKDAMWPVRFIKKAGNALVEHRYLKQQYYHFGYARKPQDVHYKMSIHGHKNELRLGWFTKKFLVWSPGVGDVHPTCRDVWTPEAFDKSELPELMKEHPYYDMDIIV